MEVTTQDKLGRLPSNVLVRIWSHLDDPVPLTRTCKSFRAAGKDTQWRAKWFMQHYELCEVIFYAIARPKIFSPALLEELMRLGAPLSRHCVQLLHYMHDPELRKTYHRPAKSKWGRVNDASYAAVKQQAVQLYGEDISYDFKKCDSYLFAKWCLSKKNKLKNTAIRRVFSFGKFIPLPLAIGAIRNPKKAVARYQVEDENRVVNVVTDDPLEMFIAVELLPSLATLAVANGWELHTGRMEQLLYNVIQEWASEPKIMQLLDELFPRKAPVPISMTLGSSLIRSELQQRTIKYGPVIDLLQDLEYKNAQPIMPGYEVMLRLLRSERVPFTMREVIDDMPAWMQLHVKIPGQFNLKSLGGPVLTFR